MAKRKEQEVTCTAESAFHALDLPDADDLVLRADLMRKVAEVIAGRGLTHAEAGKLMRMDEPRVRALLDGRIGMFATSQLLKALSDLGQNVELRITPARGRKGRLRVAA